MTHQPGSACELRPHAHVRLFQICPNKIDQILGELRGNPFPCATGQMEADVGFEHLAHETVDAATNGGEQHQLRSAIFIGGERALEGIELSAKLAQALREFEFFFVGSRHLQFSFFL